MNEKIIKPDKEKMAIYIGIKDNIIMIDFRKYIDRIILTPNDALDISEKLNELAIKLMPI